MEPNLMANLINFFIEWSSALIEAPFNGSIRDSYQLFKKIDKLSLLSFKEFNEGIIQINKLSTGAIQINNEEELNADVQCDSYFMKISYINKFSLLILIDLMGSRGYDEKISIQKSAHVENNLQCLQRILDYQPSNDIFDKTTKRSQLKELNFSLHKESLRMKLTREKLRMTTEMVPFYEICDSKQHVSYLLSAVSNNGGGGDYDINVKMVFDHDLKKCIDTKIHFIPILQQQTDIKLGDCSYLDTCHKMSSCRYVHYHQLKPKKGAMDMRIKEFNDSIDGNKRISDFTWGDPVGDLTREVSTRE